MAASTASLDAAFAAIAAELDAKLTSIAAMLRVGTIDLRLAASMRLGARTAADTARTAAGLQWSAAAAVPVLPAVLSPAPQTVDGDSSSLCVLKRRKHRRLVEDPVINNQYLFQ